MEFALNDKQREAVEHRGGPLLIIAGAGTGKTAVITQRIVDLIRSGDAKPSQILALTFTEKAANEMIERVDIALPLGYEEVMISTFHSFCDSMLRESGVYIGLDSRYELMTQAQSYIFFKKHIYELPLDRFRPAGKPTSFIGDILRLFSRLQDEDVTPEDYIKYGNSLKSDDEVSSEQKADQLELAQVYKAYSDLKIQHSMLDFGDLIMLSLKLLREKPDILNRYRKRFKYILVDEFQDTNYTQSVLVNVLALGKDYLSASEGDRNNAEITVVGDDDQAIYKFRGAAISNILHFKNIYPTAKRIVLTHNYRSDQRILDAAYTLIQQNNPDRLELTESVNKRLISQVGDPSPEDPINLLIGENDVDEAEQVARQILRLTGNIDKLKEDTSIVDKRFDSEGQAMFVDMDTEGGGYDFNEIALLIRAHSQSDQFVKVFKKYGIPFKFGGSKALYYRPEVSFLIAYLKLLANYKDDLSMFNILKHTSMELSARDILEVTRAASKDRKVSIVEFLEAELGVKLGESSKKEIESATYSQFMTHSLTQQGADKIRELMIIINDGMNASTEEVSIGTILLDFFKRIGFMDQLLTSAQMEDQFKIQNISKYFNLIKEYEDRNKDHNISMYVDYLGYSIDIGETPSIDTDALEGYNAVNILTIHGSKGLEFPVVFLVNLVAQRFPVKNRTDGIPIPDPLIRDLIPDVDAKTEGLREERRLFYVGATRAKEKLYLTAAKIYGDGVRSRKPSIFLDELLNRSVEEDFKNNSQKTISLPSFNVAISTDSDNIELRGISGWAPEKISYTHLSTYEMCPKKYKYQYVYKIPIPERSSLSFGRSIHNTLLHAYEMLRDHQEGFAEMIHAPELEDFLTLYEREWISEGYDSSAHELARKKEGEKIIRKFFNDHYSKDQKPIALEERFRFRMNEVILTGSIDRIDIIGEGPEKVVEIFDYKTGKPKSGEKAKDNLQLKIYSLVATEGLGLKVGKASLLYVEEGVKMSVEDPIVDRASIQAEITKVMEGIKEARFDATPGFQCSFCDFRDICEDALVVK